MRQSQLPNRLYRHAKLAPLDPRGLRLLGAGAHFPVKSAEAHVQRCSLGPIEQACWQRSLSAQRSHYNCVVLVDAWFPMLAWATRFDLTIGQPSYGIPRACQTKTQLWVGEADQARPPQIPRELEHARIDFLIMEVSALRDQLARMPTRGTSPARRSGSSSRLRSSAPQLVAHRALMEPRIAVAAAPAAGLPTALISFGWRAKTGSAPDRFHTALSACRRHP